MAHIVGLKISQMAKFIKQVHVRWSQVIQTLKVYISLVGFFIFKIYLTF